MNLNAVQLTRRDAAALVRLLGELQTHLESAIESGLVPGETEPREQYGPDVAADRRTWRRAEDLVMLLTEQLGRSRKRKARP